VVVIIGLESILNSALQIAVQKTGACERIIELRK